MHDNRAHLRDREVYMASARKRNVKSQIQVGREETKFISQSFIQPDTPNIWNAVMFEVLPPGVSNDCYRILAN